MSEEGKGVEGKRVSEVERLRDREVERVRVMVTQFLASRAFPCLSFLSYVHLPKPLS